MARARRGALAPARPSDPATRYRQGALLLAARRSERKAAEALEAVIARPGTPPHVYATACYHAAQAHEQQGIITRAIELYRLVVGAFGVDPALKSDAQRALARLARVIARRRGDRCARSRARARCRPCAMDADT